MDNARVKAVTEAAAEVYGLGVDNSAMLLRGAVMSMYLGNRITRDELDWSEVMLALAEVTGQLADETVLWLRQGAEKVPEPFGTVIQQAAEFLHDYWSEIIPAEI